MFINFVAKEASNNNRSCQQNLGRHQWNYSLPKDKDTFKKDQELFKKEQELFLKDNGLF